ncbi:MAG: ATP-dependent DNA helicase [Steroidobacteraceae bacterium]
MPEIDAVFGVGGALERHLSGFVPRASQRQMAERIAQALRQRDWLLVEAGTGTGKTFAYLVPVLLSGTRVLISTGTRTLQDQLFHRDLPLLGAALGRPLAIALLKGRTNYLCKLRLEQLREQPDLFPGAQRPLLAALRQWAVGTASGDLAELPQLPDVHPLRPALTATREQCLGVRCVHFAGCHVFEARRRALAADVVVVNHHLLMADLALKEEGFGELLPSVGALILDEAHQLPDLAAEFFGVRLASRQIETLAQDARRELVLLGIAGREPDRVGALLENALQECVALLGRADRQLDWRELDQPVRHSCEALGEALQGFASEVQALGEQPALAQLAGRARLLAAAVAQLADTAGIEGARTVTTHARGFVLSLLPYDVSTRFRALLEQHPAAWIFTSATLAIGSDFRHFSERLGLMEAATLRIESPFDYAHQGLMYLPRDLPDPGAPGYTEALLRACWPLVTAARGGAFLLFTSHRALQLAAQWLRAQEELPGPLLVQGEAPREQLLRNFRAAGNALLLGTASFWEGVDVQGHALRLVIIDKLPFVAPDDPLVRARIEHLQQIGGNAFREYQLPEAIIALKQGVGRLIRSESDRGVVVLCDPRLHSRSYGRAFLASLPPMARTRERAAAEAFLRAVVDAADTEAALAELPP